MRAVEHLAIRMPPELGQRIRAELARRHAMGEKLSQNALAIELLEKALATSELPGSSAP
jgi:hypothetical protein